jgi:hypothetical protein
MPTWASSKCSTRMIEEDQDGKGRGTRSLPSSRTGWGPDGLDQKARKRTAGPIPGSRTSGWPASPPTSKPARSYAKGCYIVTLGDRIVLYRGEWYYEPEDGDPEIMDIPLTQHIQFDDSEPGTRTTWG